MSSHVALASNAVLKPLRLPLGDPRLIACGWVGFDDVQMQQSWTAAADLEPMARPTGLGLGRRHQLLDLYAQQAEPVPW